MNNYTRFGVVIAICLHLGFMGQVYHAGYIEGQAYPVGCIQELKNDSKITAANRATAADEKLLLSAFANRTTRRDFRKQPVILFRSQNRVHGSCDIPCQEQESSGYVPSLAYLPSSSRTGLMIDKFTIAQTMESASNYHGFDIASLRQNPNVDVTSTTSLRSDVPAVYGAWHMFNITEDPDLYTAQRQDAAVAFVSNCQSQFRMDVMKLLRELGIPVHNYGACQQTHREEPASSLDRQVLSPLIIQTAPSNNADIEKQAAKTKTLRKYKFCLAFENSQEEDYVTEKYWQCLSHGGLTVVIGPPNAMDYAPSGTNSILHIPNLEAVPAIAQRMLELMKDEAQFRELLQWKTRGPSQQFAALLDLDNVDCTCRFCIHAGDRLWRESSRQEPPGLCSVGDAHLIEIRERGTFYFQPIVLRQLTVRGLHTAVQHALDYVPRYRSIRSDWYHGKVYRVYPYDLNQRDALYDDDKALTSDDKVFNAVTSYEGPQCLKLEVILV